MPPNLTSGSPAPHIRTRTRLVVGDVLTPDFTEDATSYAVIGGQATRLVAADPVALDRVGLRMATDALGRAGRDAQPVERWATRWLAEGQRRGLGVGDLGRIQVERVRA